MKVKGCKHYESKVIPNFESGGKVTSMAMGRAAKAQRDQSSMNQRMRDALATTDAVRRGDGFDGSNGPAPAKYGNLKNERGYPAKKLSAEDAVRDATYGRSGSLQDATKKLAADAKQAKEGRR